MDSTETISDGATTERENGAPTGVSAEPTAPAGQTAATDATAETPAPTTDVEGAPRPHRRRRRRRRPHAAAAQTAAGAGMDPPTSKGDGITSAPAGGNEGAASESQADVAASVEGDGSAETPANGEPARPILRLRSRRRRRRPAMPGILPGPAESAGASDGGDGAAAPSIAARPALAPGQRSFSVPRRRRRQLPLSAAEAAPAEAGAIGAQPAGDTEAPSGEFIAPRRRRRRRRPAAAATVTADATQSTQSNPTRARGGPGGLRERNRRSDGRNGDAGSPTARRDDRGERSGERREAGPRDRRDDRGDRRGPPGRGRAGSPRTIERKLYSVDAVVDRGFDDVEEEDGTRRVHWTIVKRTTADQISRKALSASYVLQREGTDSEFPSLGAARAAVNKTIVHPEKLTRSKAEHAAERAGKK